MRGLYWDTTKARLPTAGPIPRGPRGPWSPPALIPASPALFHSSPAILGSPESRSLDPLSWGLDRLVTRFSTLIREEEGIGKETRRGGASHPRSPGGDVTAPGAEGGNWLAPPRGAHSPPPGCGRAPGYPF